MKAKKVSVNKNDKNPNGVEIEVIEPEGDLEIGTLTFLLEGQLRALHSAGILKMDLPEHFALRYQAEGSFLVSSTPAGTAQSPYYSPPRPIGVVAVQSSNGRFDLAYAELKQGNFATGKPEAKAEEKKDDKAKGKK